MNGLAWHCCLAGSSKTPTRVLIFSIVMVADYSFDVKNIDICAPTFFKHNNSFIATVHMYRVRKQDATAEIKSEFIFIIIRDVEAF